MWNWIEKLTELHASQQPFAIVTVTRCSGSPPRETGAKMLVHANGELFGTIGGGQLEHQVRSDALLCIQEGVTKTIHYPLYASVHQCCGGVVEVLVEVLNQNPAFYLFGAGHVGQALCRTLAGTPFQVHLIDERTEWVHAPELPADVVRHQKSWDSFAHEARWDKQHTYVAIMTHEHELDLEILRGLLSRPTRYLGMIGSATKWKSFQEKLLAAGAPQAQLDRVKCPIGLALGGKSPQEVAISIAAELLTVHHGK